MLKIVHVQSVLTEDDVALLKEATDCDTVKDALTKATEHYIKVVGSLSDKQKKKLKGITGKQMIDDAILKVILSSIDEK